MPVAGDQLVAEEPDDRGGGDRPQMGDLVWVQQSADGLVRGEDRGQGDHGDHEQPGQVLGAAVAVGVALGSRLPAERERDQQRNGGQRVGDVVERVTEEPHRPGQCDYYSLQKGGQAEAGQADQQGPSPGLVGFESVVDLVRGVVEVPAHQFRQRVPHPAPPPGWVVSALVVAVVAMAVRMAPGFVVVVAIGLVRCGLRR
jgi:hypothetical protein